MMIRHSLRNSRHLLRDSVCLLASLLCLVAADAGAEPSGRLPVKMPLTAQDALRGEMLMKLQTVYAVEAALADNQPANAAEQVERYLGTGAMGQHRKLPPEARPGMYLPDAMHAIGMQSHRLGSDLSAALKDGERARIDATLRDLLGTCVACHSTYRLAPQ